MRTLSTQEAVDYLIIGHIAKDMLDTGFRLGGTAIYASLTASSLGLKTGIVTSGDASLDLSVLKNIPVVMQPSSHSTTFKNIYTAEGRVQYIYHTASQLHLDMVPSAWRYPKIVHIGPIAQEVDAQLTGDFRSSLVGLTPQGWMRAWNAEGRISFDRDSLPDEVLDKTDIVILSLEDVQGNEKILEDLVLKSRILVVTEGKDGARVYWNGDVRCFRPPAVEEIDSTGAGDIFAASFFYRYLNTHNPWEAARFANQIAAISVTRPGIEGIPTREEIKEHLIEVM
jgi:sugar/nucleoside kinase (ribokinase family)